MATILFRSPLALRLQSFLDTRRVGNRRQGEHHQKILRYLDQFLMSELLPGQTITQKVVELFNESMSHLNPNTRINRLSVLRQFCLYLSHFDPRTCIIYRSYSPRRSRPVPHIYTRDEVRKIMAAARKLGPRGSFRPIVISTLIGLLYSTGLRIGEALNLNLGEINLKRQVIEVRQGKFGKARYVPLSSSTVSHMKIYLDDRRKAGFSNAQTSSVFPNIIGKKHGHPAFVTVFLEILRSLGLRGPKGQRGPRVHDLRHTFAVERLMAWYRAGSHLGAKLPLLSTYLGHSTVTGTEIYLHATAQLLQSAGRRFHQHFAIPVLIAKKK